MLGVWHGCVRAGSRGVVLFFVLSLFWFCLFACFLFFALLCMFVFSFLLIFYFVLFVLVFCLFQF